jgi:5'-nucleotidase
MKIIVTNDDGIDSPVLSVLADALSLEHDVQVVAPAQDQSGMSHSFTHGFNHHLAYRVDTLLPYPKYQVSGTPCDCVKFAIAHLQTTRKVDLVLSGINLGENAGMSTIYSGTVGAAREGAMWGIPSIAVSVWKNTPDRLEHAVAWLVKLLRQPNVLPTLPGGLWNINFPPCEPALIEGVEITSMSTVMFADSYEPVQSEHGLTRFRLVGYKPGDRFLPGSDDYALSRNRISITPLQIDQSDSVEKRRLAGLELKAHWDSL